MIAGTTILTACTGSGSTSDPSTAAGGSPSTTTTRSSDPGASNDELISFTKVSRAQAKKLEQIVVRAPGVRSVGYVPPTRTVQIYFTSSATVKERATAKQLVHQTLSQQAAPSTPKHKHHHHRHHRH